MRHRVDDEQKRASGTWRKDRARPPGKARVLAVWPPAPRDWSAGKRRAWERIGRDAVASGSISEGELLAAEIAAEAVERWDALRADPKAPVTAVNAAGRMALDTLKALKLTPTTRGHDPAPAAQEAGADLDGEFGARR